MDYVWRSSTCLGVFGRTSTAVIGETMIHVCGQCKKIIKDGDRISFGGEATYRLLKSSITYALDKSDMEIYSDTLEHVECND